MTTYIDVEDLLNRYAAGERDFSELIVEPSDELSMADLRGINLSNSSLDEVFMEKSNLHGATLQGARFGQACLRSCNLTDADLGDADLGYANLNGADLTGANLTNANLKSTQLLRANLTNAILKGAKGEINPENLRNCTFGNTVMPDGSIRN